MLHQLVAAAVTARRYGITLALVFCGMAAGHAGTSGLARDQSAQPSKLGREPASYCAFELGRGLVAEAINNRNQIAGTASLGDLAEAFVWDSDEGVRLLGVLPGAAISVGNDINDRGQVVGNSGGGDLLQQPFIWDERRGMRTFATLGGESASATHINNLGQIIGLSSTAAEEGEHLYFRRVNGEVVDLGDGIPFGVNDRGFVGFSRQSQQPPPTSDVFLWHFRKGERELRGFPEDRLILPSALNDRKHIVGSANQDDQQPHAMRWTPGKGMVFLASLNESGFSHAADVNEWGTVVGYVDLGFAIRPFIWRKRSGVRDLTTLIDPTSPATPQAETIAARSINDRGWIALNTSDRVGTNPRAYVLRPNDDHMPCPSPPPIFGN